MKRFALAGGLMVAAFTGVMFAQDKTLKELDGTYKVTSMEKVGKVATKDVTDSVKVSIKGEELLIKVGDEEKKARIAVDSSKTPNTIDISPTDGPEKGKTFPGIYKFDKGELTLAFTEKGDRPKEFKVEGEVVVMKMKKDEKKKDEKK
jgi:uncharacterized protein (TIGR03067 family)